MVRRYRFGEARNTDPRWLTLKYAYTAADGITHPVGARALYYPATKRMVFGEEAEQAYRDFDAARQDEEFMQGQFPGA